jgi:hypothetical protein
MNRTRKARGTGIALALIALLAAPAACGRYGEPTRGGASARSAPVPALQPADGSGESGEECPPEEQQTQQKARIP